MEKFIIKIVCLCALIVHVKSIRKYRNEDDVKHHYRNAFSDVHHPRFSNEAKLMIRDLHNFYRGNVTPPAADMKFMEWDDELEHLAQIWADNCILIHGKPRSPYSKGNYGQLLYYGTDHTGYTATKLWYETSSNYNFEEKKCDAYGCNQFIQMAWAESSRIGCGVRKCNDRYLIVCNYFTGAVRNAQIYNVGKPCSLCTDENRTLCWNNLCVSEEQCERNPGLCAEREASCNLECHNCGRLNTTTCQCACADGWDLRDCSRRCLDSHEYCGRDPGFPNSTYCSLNNSVANSFCRYMCGKCNIVSEESWNICCEGKLCENGYILNTDSCSCVKLCPGPACDTIKSEEISEKEDALNQKELELIEMGEYLKRKEKVLETKEKFLKEKEMYLEEKETFLRNQESILLSRKDYQ